MATKPRSTIYEKEYLSEDLLKRYVQLDEKVILYGENDEDKKEFEIPLSITSAKMFSPVLKVALETQIGKINGDEKPAISHKSNSEESEVSSSDQSENEVKNEIDKSFDQEANPKRIRVYGFGYKAVKTFVNCLLTRRNLYTKSELERSYEFSPNGPLLWC